MVIKRIKRLNPESTFELAEATDQRFDAQIKSDTNLQNLILPMVIIIQVIQLLIDIVVMKMF